MSLWLLLAAHFIADFFLQSADWAEKKTQKFWYLVGHALVYTVVFALVAFLCIPAYVVWIPFVIIALSHFIIDWIRVLADKKFTASTSHFTSFLIDQALHIFIIFTLVCMFDLNGQNKGWISDLALRIPLEQVLRYALIFLTILDPASVFVKKLSSYVSGSANNSSTKREPPAGSTIGKLERIIIAILVICGELGAIGFVLTAKSLARYKQLSEKDFAEKYLVGTLSSTAIAIITALLLK